MAEQPAASALADFLNEYRRDHCMGVSCSNLMDAAADMLRTQCTEGKIMFDALTHIDDVADTLDGAEHVARTALSMVADVRSDAASGRRA